MISMLWLYFILSPYVLVASYSNPRTSCNENKSSVQREINCGTVPLIWKKHNRNIADDGPRNQTNRIMNGGNTIPGEAPWIVFIRICDTSVCTRCTGSLIDARWVLTAGHCWKDVPLTNYTIVLGKHELETEENSRMNVSADKIVKHPEFYGNRNDLMLIRLVEGVDFNDFIQPLCIVQPIKDIVQYTRGKICYIFGFGQISKLTFPEKLQKLRVEAYDWNDCETRKLRNFTTYGESTCIKSFSISQKSVSCPGDSGGPNVCYEPEIDRWVQFGVMARGPTICSHKVIDWFETWFTESMNLSKFGIWINETRES